MNLGYLLVSMSTQQLSLSFFSCFPAVLCFHFFSSLQVTLASQGSHARPSLLLQTPLHALQLSMKHTEKPLLGLSSGLTLRPQAAQQ